MKTVIQCSNLGKCYQIYDDPKLRLKQALWGNRRQYFREFWALRDISFEVEPGESLGIIGRNGSGKSTLLQLICRTLTPTEGSVYSNGRIAALLELGSGFNPEFTGVENVYLNASMLGLDKGQTDRVIEDIFAFADIGEFISQPVKTYSSGMAVRLAFAVIAHVNADILVVDEALAVGDAVFVQRCMRFIRKIREERCLLFVSHDAEAVKSLCSHSLWISNGRLREQGDCRKVCLSYHRYCMSETYGEIVKVEAIGTNPKEKDHGESNEQYPTPPDSLSAQKDYLDYNSMAYAIDNLSNAEGWKTGKAELIRISLRCVSSNTTEFPLKGGEEVEVEVVARINGDISKPAIGFTLTNRLGQHLIGENTLIYTDSEGDLPSKEGDILAARFRIVFPMLPTGKYMLMASIADGDLNDHIQHHWTENAMLIEVVSSRVRYGLVGCFLKDAKLEKL